MAQYARPDVDSIVGWNPYPSSPTTRWDKIDEETPDDDETYIYREGSGLYQCGLSNLTDPGVHTGHIMRCRVKVVSGSGKGEKIEMILKQGVGFKATTGEVGLTRGSYIDIQYTLTEEEAAAITDYTELRFEFNPSSQEGEEVRVTWAELEVPDAPTYKLEGISKDKDGNALGSCLCFLCKDNLDNTCSYVAYTLSDSVTGAYSFTGLTDNDPQYYVISWKDNTPHVFDVTDHVLQPILE